jgi:hypothetical protein
LRDVHHLQAVLMDGLAAIRFKSRPSERAQATGVKPLRIFDDVAGVFCASGLLWCFHVLLRLLEKYLPWTKVHVNRYMDKSPAWIFEVQS